MLSIMGEASSRQVKLLAGLQRKKLRDKSGLFMVEGLRLAETAANSDYETELAVFSPKFAQTPRGQNLLAQLENNKIPLYEADDKAMAKICEVDTPQGIVMAVRQKVFTLSNLQNKANPLFVVLDNVQDPGNVGTIIRTADAAGASGVIATKGTVDVWSGKVVRSAMGSHFHLPVVGGVSIAELTDFWGECNIKAYAGLLNPGSLPYYEADLRQSAIIVSNEAFGISRELLPYVEPIHIPMPGSAESLNVATAAAVIIFGAVRQRNGK